MELESRILHLLENNARLSCKAIATMLDEDEARIKSIIEQMEKQKIILGYNTIINWELLGNDGVTAMIDVKVTPEREVGFNSVAEQIYRYSEVRCVYLMSRYLYLSVVVNGGCMRDHFRVISFLSYR